MCTLCPTDISILGNNKLSTKQFPVVRDRHVAAEPLLRAHPEIQHCTFSLLLKSFTVLSLQTGRNAAVTGEDPSDQRTSEDYGEKRGDRTEEEKHHDKAEQEHTASLGKSGCVCMWAVLPGSMHNCRNRLGSESSC